MTHVEEKYNWLLWFLVHQTNFPTDWYVPGEEYPDWLVEDIAQELHDADPPEQDETWQDYISLVREQLEGV